jgi:hypothetical protein
MDTNQFNGAFWIAMAASVSGFIVVVVTALNKSKCSNVRFCCGLFSCTRDTQAEADIEEKQIELEEIKIARNSIKNEDGET